MSIVLDPGQGKNLNVLGLEFTTKATGDDTGNAYVLNEVTVRAETPPLPVHIHKNEEEGIYVIEGNINIEVGDRTVKGSPGSFVLVSRGTPHTLSLEGSASGKVMLIFSPPKVQGLFEEIAGETDMEVIMAAAAKYGMEIVQR